VRLEANESNLGFASANNAVMRKAEGRVFFLLNADMVVPPGTTAALFSRIDSAPDVGAAACRQVDAQGDTLESCMFDYMDGRIPGRIDPPGPSDDRTWVEAAWVWGSGVMVRREVFERIGGFDESFFMYYEDLEWCWRIRQAGWHVRYCDDVFVRHFVRRSTSRVPARTTATRLVAGELSLMQRFMSPRRFRRFLIGRFCYSLRGIAFYRAMLALAPCEKYHTKYLRYLANVSAIAMRSPRAQELRRRWLRVVGRERHSPPAARRG
jgi:GT2 family glycosyltransferase